MNKTELAYGKHLDLRYAAGEVIWWDFEPIRFRIGEGVFYGPDFALMLTDGRIEIHETKGTKRSKETGEDKAFTQEAANVRLRTAASLFPFVFKRVFFSKLSGNWIEELITPEQTLLSSGFGKN